MIRPQPELGSAVVPRMGRDAGRPMLVIGVVDENYVLVADGMLRRVCNPKKKKLKHLNWKNVVHEGVAQMFAQGDLPTDAQVRQAICDVFGCNDGRKERELVQKRCN